VSQATRPPSADATSGSDAEPTEEGGADSVSTDEIFELLSNKRRRFTLHYLKHGDERAELGELSEYVASWENETTVQEVDSAARKRVYTSLQSHHLPKMDELGIVDYDDRAGVVELDESADDLDVYLEVVEGRDVPWSQYYLGLAAVDAGLVAAAAVNAWPFGALPDVAWAAFVVTTLLVSAAVHMYHDSTQRLGEHEKPPEIREQ
jgi:DNA-binding transcriptional ArsR family regulator